MNNVKNRIETNPRTGIDFIALEGEELEVYDGGGGYRLARFENGRLTALFDPLHAETAGDALREGIAWMQSAQQAEHWLVRPSCTTLCEPEKIDLAKAGTFAMLALAFAESFGE